MSSLESDQALRLVLRAVESLRKGEPVDVCLLRGPLAELLEDAAAGDDEGVISPYAEAVAAVVLGQSDQTHAAVMDSFNQQRRR